MLPPHLLFWVSLCWGAQALSLCTFHWNQDKFRNSKPASFHALSFPDLLFLFFSLFFFKALFPSQFSKSPAQKLTGEPSEGRWDCRSCDPSACPGFHSAISTSLKEFQVRFGTQSLLLSELEQHFFCVGERWKFNLMTTWKSRGFYFTNKESEWKDKAWYHKISTLNTNTWYKTRNSELQSWDLQAKQRSQERAEFPISHPLEVALQQNSNKVV